MNSTWKSGPALGLILVLFGTIAKLSSCTSMEYSYTDSNGSVQVTGAEVKFPSAKPKGVILIWHGTILGGLPDMGSTVEDNFATMTEIIEASDEFILVMPHQLGLGQSKGTRNQLWQQLTPVEKDGDAALTAVYTKARTDYGLEATERMNLFVMGHSQGGTSSLVYHLHFQKENNPLTKMYELKSTTASAGHYSAAVWESTTMTTMADFTTDENVQASYSAEYYPMAREMQMVLLTHLLHTYNAFVGESAAVAMATPPADVGNAEYKDNWSDMAQMIGLLMNGSDDSASTPACVTEAAWAQITDPSSDTRKALQAYLKQQYDGIATHIAKNSVALDVVYACNDFNVPCQHSKVLQATAPQQVNFHDATQSTPIESPFDGHGWAQAKFKEVFDAAVNKLKDDVPAPATFEKAEDTCGSSCGAGDDKDDETNDPDQVDKTSPSPVSSPTAAPSDNESGGNHVMGSLAVLMVLPTIVWSVL
eukprot:CAMPEP_0197863496 /NCGR_PEP_ID=MMETSP1438-20131217/40971_1 /TAXON_ID=1461541 /ORGANISM="Pterosperma sp., Strain CCMP1384" /LENGTH=477 /DNA_ID=CAMNT_0043481401 /DNA_START=145 /DNA_END=1581 /DNA_ORIENTATION=+